MKTLLGLILIGVYIGVVCYAYFTAQLEWLAGAIFTCCIMTFISALRPTPTEKRKNNEPEYEQWELSK